MKTELTVIFRLVACLSALVLSAPVGMAADIASFGVVKYQRFIQTGVLSSVPDAAGPFAITFFAEPSDFSAVSSISVTPPGSTPIPLPESSSYTLTDSRLSQAQLNDTYKTGAFNFAFVTANDGTVNVAWAVPADAFPNTPSVSNFAGLAAVTATSDLKLSWSPFNQGTAQDLIRLRIESDSGFDVFDSGSLGDASALNGLQTETTISAGRFEPGGTYTAHLTFSKIAVHEQPASYPGVDGYVVFSSETQFKIAAVAAATGGIAPTLLFANPANGATNVPVNLPIALVFSGPMAPSQSISWSGAGVNPANFSYTWPQPNTLLCTYNGDLPGGTKITYTLNPASAAIGFKSTDGASLATVTGSLTTTGTPPPSGSTSALRLEIPSLLPNNTLKARVTGKPSSVCVIEQSENLKNWSTLQQVTLSADGAGEITFAGGLQAAFLRVRSQ